MQSRYRQSKNIITRRIAGETLLIPIRQHLADLQRIYVLDAVGETIWRALDGRRSTEDIAALVEQEFDVSRKTALADTRRFCNELLDAGLIQAVS